MTRLPLALLGLVAVAACGPANRSLDTQKAPVVSSREAGYELRFTGDNLDAAQAAAFTSYLDALQAGYGDRVAATAVTPGQRGRIDALLTPRGLRLEAMPIGAAAPGIVRLTLRQSSAAVSRCPDWDRKSNPEIAGSAMSNFGCGVQSNLAAMIADPSEILEGKTYSGADGFVIAKGADAYRKKPATGLKSLDRGDTTTRGEQ